MMLQNARAFSGYSVNDQAKAKEFYGQTLGLSVDEDKMGLNLKLEGTTVFIYAKPDHAAASFTVLNFIVEDINASVAELKEKGVTFEAYDFGNGAKTDDQNIMRGIAANQGPDIAWFKDPAGNVLAVLQEA